MGSVVIIMLAAVAVAALARQKLASGVLGKREAYGRPMSDWAGASLLGLGLGLALLVAGLNALAFLTLGGVLFMSYLTVSQVKPRRRR
ncbi:MAG: hypothetical protein ACRDZ7_20750 [Acidimicrobiia bacterium]